MNEQNPPQHLSTRRDFIKSSGKIAAVGALAGVTLPHVFAAEDSTIKLALVGCGGRGTGAAANALSVSASLASTKLVAMADVFEHRLANSYSSLEKKFTGQVDVPPDRKFISFEG